MGGAVITAVILLSPLVSSNVSKPEVDAVNESTGSDNPAVLAKSWTKTDAASHLERLLERVRLSDAQWSALNDEAIASAK